MDAASADLLRRARRRSSTRCRGSSSPRAATSRGGFVAPEHDDVLHARRRSALPPEAALALAEAVTDSAPVPPHRLRARGRALRRQPAAAARPPALGRRRRGDAPGLDRDRRARARRPARARRAHARAPRGRARRDLPPAPPRRRARPGLPGAGRRHLGPALRRHHGRWARATCASAARSSATPPTPRSRSPCAAGCTPRVAARLATERSSQPGRARARRSRCTTRAPATRPRRGRTRGSPPGTPRSGSPSPTPPCSCAARWRPRGRSP